MGQKHNVARSVGLTVLQAVFDGQSLANLQSEYIDPIADVRDRGLCMEIVNGVLRWRWQLEFFLSCLLEKPLKSKDRDIETVILMAVYELHFCRTPAYAVVNEAVELVNRSRKRWAASLVNAVLRRFQREHDALQLQLQQQPEATVYSHPDWMLRQFKSDWPEDGDNGWRRIAKENNQRAANYLRINAQQTDNETYRELLENEGVSTEMIGLPGSDVAAIRLEQSTDIRRLPGFDRGLFSVQDLSAQLAARLLPVRSGQRVLDLCAAPGGKTSHLLERYPDMVRLTAVEIDATRMQRVEQNLARLQLKNDNVELVTADAADYSGWWNGNPYDCILIDAPCSASGVIRRHPDIKSLRRPEDITRLVELQAAILESAWHMLVEGGVLLYITCSVFRDENDRQIGHFLQQHSDAGELQIAADWGIAAEHGRQLLPGPGDGFYYCLLVKKN